MDSGQITRNRLQHERFLAALREGLADSEAGRLVDDDALTAELDAELAPDAAAPRVAELDGEE